MSFGREIRSLRENIGWSQSRLSMESRWNAQSISDVERGVRPPPDLGTVRAVAVALGADPVELMTLAAVERGAVDRPEGISDEAWQRVAAQAVAELERLRVTSDGG